MSKGGPGGGLSDGGCCCCCCCCRFMVERRGGFCLLFLRRRCCCCCCCCCRGCCCSCGGSGRAVYWLLALCTGEKKLFSETLMYLLCILLLTDLLFASESGRVVFSCSTSMSRCRTVPGSSPPAPVPGRCPCTSTWPWACACARVLEKPDLTVCLLLLLSWGPSGRAKVAYG